MGDGPSRGITRDVIDRVLAPQDDSELDEATNPLEASLGWTVKLNKGEFIGHDALAKIKEQGLKRKLIGIEMVERGVCRDPQVLRLVGGSADDRLLGDAVSSAVLAVAVSPWPGSAERGARPGACS